MVGKIAGVMFDGCFGVRKQEPGNLESIPTSKTSMHKRHELELVLGSSREPGATVSVQGLRTHLPLRCYRITIYHSGQAAALLFVPGTRYLRYCYHLLPFDPYKPSHVLF